MSNFERNIVNLTEAEYLRYYNLVTSGVNRRNALARVIWGI